jgi:hypothetical protein
VNALPAGIVASSASCLAPTLLAIKPVGRW